MIPEYFIQEWKGKETDMKKVIVITLFAPSATGNCRYQLDDDVAWNNVMLERIRMVNKTH